MLVVCDIDGTISDCRHRQHLAVAGDWDAFHALLSKDEPITTVLYCLSLLAPKEDFCPDLIFLTGRPETYREETLAWFSENCFLELHDDFKELLMRPKDDFSKDTVLKLELLEKYLAGTDFEKHQVVILEDRDAVVAMWRDNGYTCFQTAQGAF